MLVKHRMKGRKLSPNEIMDRVADHLCGPACVDVIKPGERIEAGADFMAALAFASMIFHGELRGDERSESMLAELRQANASRPEGAPEYICYVQLRNDDLLLHVVASMQDTELMDDLDCSYLEAGKGEYRFYFDAVQRTIAVVRTSELEANLWSKFRQWNKSRAETRARRKQIKIRRRWLVEGLNSLRYERTTTLTDAEDAYIQDAVRMVQQARPSDVPPLAYIAKVREQLRRVRANAFLTQERADRRHRCA